MNEIENQKNKGFFGWIERVGNKLPDPVVLFMILAAIVIGVSGIAGATGLSVEYFDAEAGENLTVEAISLLSAEGLNHIFNSAVDNFTGFAPLGTVLVTMLGVGIAEWTGLIESTLKRLLSNVPAFLLSAAVVFAGIISNIASDVGYVVIIPLGALIFAGAGRHPLAGLAAAFAGVSGGFSANLLVGPTDALLVDIANAALTSAGIEYNITITANWYFMIVSTIVLTVVGALITDKFVEPRLGEYHGDYRPDFETLTKDELKGLRNALIVLVIYAIIMAVLMFPQGALFRSYDEAIGAESINDFLATGLLLAIFLLFALPGLAYGITVGKIKSSSDFVKGMTEAMSSMGNYIVLAFFAAQLIDYFNYTNLGTILAVSGADLLESVNLTGLPLILGFIGVSGFINLFIGSASAKWAILAPIFTPMLYNLNIAPEMTLVAYRIADSSTNVISPLLNYFPMILIFAQRYDKKAGIGTLVSTMLAYSMAFLVTWTILLIIWFLLGLSLGPGASITL
ncbi:AbgT family transporter [Tetragenococcus koreensis]|uniref:Aminobenzoyl-glutamate transporter n=1 Tax=Tetragenococcus koreensis TaxID=290335 RepID=A0AAN4UBL6_9ENTE|nr:AbgT family transporter [Tetragenococcus koreensis]AYW45845.1 aminobenzoyl-glutamate transporter [Tetragenococcus koreensis]MCF1585139.1 AbgT family transporter [Tetragenococcus koreensis]MCF1614723.1 AbgT family transporter [Tetragenococcus koreensis]MCF1616692.1 AbgT family transporter [Tetragenococcus koreensis]MCF1619067.1 AbgT family transporter [Tetragenococcus koreensis]